MNGERTRRVNRRTWQEEVIPFLKRYGLEGKIIPSVNGEVIDVNGKGFWMHPEGGDWYTYGMDEDKGGYGPVTNLIHKTLHLEPKLRNMYYQYGVDLSDVPEDANRNILQHYGDRRLNTYKNLVKDNLDAWFHGEKSIPEDALDDYEEESYGDHYMSLADLLDSGLSPEDWQALKKDFAEEILADRRRYNENNDKHPFTNDDLPVDAYVDPDVMDNIVKGVKSDWE